MKQLTFELEPAKLRRTDFIDFSEAQRKILTLLEQDRPVSAEEIISATGQREGLRRLRDLRQKLETKGYKIECLRSKEEGRKFFYKLIK